MFKVKAKTNIVLDKPYQAGAEIIVTKEQFEVLNMWVDLIGEVKESKKEDKPKASSNKGKK